MLALAVQLNLSIDWHLSFFPLLIISSRYPFIHLFIIFLLSLHPFLPPSLHPFFLSFLLPFVHIFIISSLPPYLHHSILSSLHPFISSSLPSSFIPFAIPPFISSQSFILSSLHSFLLSSLLLSSFPSTLPFLHPFLTPFILSFLFPLILSSLLFFFPSSFAPIPSSLPPFSYFSTVTTASILICF